MIENILAARYASEAMKGIWDADNKIILERQLWIAVLKAQKDLGVPGITDEVIAAYEAQVENINMKSMKQRELVTKHDVKARIEEFNALAGHQKIHEGMTSRDLTENVEQMQIHNGLLLVRDRLVAILYNLALRAEQYQSWVMAGRSHNVAAQPTTLGKRFANAGQEIMLAYHRVEALLDYYPLRGIKGPMGTQQDMLDLLGSAEKVAELEDRIAYHLNFVVQGEPQVLGSVGQIYPRSMDLDVVSVLQVVASGPASLAKTIRLMAGQELATEGFMKGQVGSSAMPHKMNARTCERICGFKAIIAGHVTMLGGVAGDQWNEGDVSDSVVRRVALQDAFLTIDGQFEALLTVLDNFGAYKAVIDKELERYLPFLTTTKVLMGLLQTGHGREEAHAAIKDNAVEAALAMREQGTDGNDLFDRLAADTRISLSAEDIQVLLSDPLEFTGLARQQVTQFVAAVDVLVEQHPSAARYQPGDIL